MFNKATCFDHLGHNEANARDKRHKKGILIIVQLDATKNSLYIILQVHSTCFVLPSSNVAKQTWHKKIWPVPEAVVIVLCIPFCVFPMMGVVDTGNM